MTVTVPPGLLARLQFLRPDADTWIEEALRRAAALAAGWDVELGAVLDGGAMSLCIDGDRSGQRVVLKLPMDTSTGHHEAAALRAWAGDSTPQVLATDPSGAFLMTFLVEGGRAPREEEVLEVLNRLHEGNPEGFRPLQVNVAARSAAATARFHRRSEFGEHLETALAMLEELISTTTDPCLLHGDFQAKNILTGQEWTYAIDPLPVVGDRLFDVGLWVGTGGAGDPATFIERHQLGDRAVRWIWALAVLEYRPARERPVLDFIRAYQPTAVAAQAA